MGGGPDSTLRAVVGEGKRNWLFGFNIPELRREMPDVFTVMRSLAENGMEVRRSRCRPYERVCPTAI